MSNLPIRRQQFRNAEFLAWLASNGAEIGKPTNPYEVCRYKAYSVFRGGHDRPKTHIVYAKENGLLTWCGDALQHYEQFLASVNPGDLKPAAPKNARKSRPGWSVRTREKLLARDGDACWYCGHPMGDDCTLEHLVPKSAEGGSSLANLALAHQLCNAKAANKPLVEKIALRTEMRAALEFHP